MKTSADDPPQRASVGARHAELMRWLLEAAYPIWSTRGLDSVRGGFYERLTLEGEPTNDARRARVQSRQIFAFAKASSLGWNGNALHAVRSGLRFFLTHYRRQDGLFRTLVTCDGAAVDDRALLYDQAFSLLAFASAAPLMGDELDLAREGEQLREAIFRHLKRTGVGFESGLPHGPPLLANPHMHLLEAALAWLDVGGGSEWRTLADELGELALSHLIDPATGMLHESFEDNWTRTQDAAGQLVEPGHQFEWAGLLMRWGQDRADAREAALCLIDIAERYGVQGGVAIDAIGSDTSVHNGTARLWPQTERLRAASLAARLYGESRYWKMTAGAARALLQYLETSVPGLWYDCRLASGDFVQEPVRAGNFYHIIGAVFELAALMGTGS